MQLIYSVLCTGITLTHSSKNPADIRLQTTIIAQFHFIKTELIDFYFHLFFLGGRYTGELKFKECTHLIVNANGPKGQKYEFAKKWKIPCVTVKVRRSLAG